MQTYEVFNASENGSEAKDERQDLPRLWRACFIGSAELTVASALIGTIIGAIAIGKPGDAFGRRRSMIVLAVFYFVSAVGSALATDWYMFLIFRFLGGLAVGGCTVLSPMYIAEIAPTKIRGRLVAVNQLNIVLGILLAFFSNYIIASTMDSSWAWRWMFGVEAFPAALFFGLLFLIPYSPRWLVTHNRIEEASRVLGKIGELDVKERIDEIIGSLHVEKDLRHTHLFCTKYRLPIFLAVAIAMFNQLSGICAVMFYAPSIFKMAGAGDNAAMLQAVAIGGTNLIFTILALTVIDHFGRRRLMFLGSIGYIISLTTVAVTFYINGTDEFSLTGSVVILMGLLLFIASHAFGQGAVIWVYISEIFPNVVRAKGQALGSFTHWVIAALVSWTFPVIAKASGGHAFIFFSLMMTLQLIFVLKIMPETKGISLEEMQHRLGIEQDESL